MEQMQTQELISALADGQLQGDAFVRGVELAAADPDAREAWQTYHLIGDVLRSGELAVGGAPSAFLARLQQRLHDEQPAAPQVAAAPVATIPARAAAANDGSFRWKMVAGAASVAAVAAITWSLVGGGANRPAGPELAKAPAGTMLSSGERAVMIRNPQLDELLAAHRQLGGASAFQTTTGFVRNATFEGSGR